MTLIGSACLANKASRKNRAGDGVAVSSGQANIMTPSHEQLARARRLLRKIENEGATDDDYDDVLSFFIHCWHVRDSIINDPSLPRTAAHTKKAINNLVNGYDSLSICADICTLTKHRKLNRRPRKGAEVTRKDLRLTPGLPAIARYQITLVDGSTRDALTVAKEAIGDWESIFTKLKM